MKKLLITLTAICAALALASCSKEEAFSKKGDVVSTTITVGTEVSTKATADADGAAAAVKRCIVQVLMGEKVYETKTIEGTAGQKTYTTSIDLINGQAYTIIAWVDAGAEVYTFDEATAKVTRVSATSAMDESLDAFYGSATLDLSATQNTQVSITAKRPLAQINLIATDTFKEGFEPTNLVVTTKAAETFDVLTGKFSGEKEYTATSSKAYTSKTLAMTYIFAEAEKSVLDVTLNATFGTAYERTFSNIPVQQNYRTNISGKFFTVGSDITVNVDPNWDDPDYDVDIFNGEVKAVTPVDDVYTITTAAELNWVAQQVNSGANNFSGKTVKLANDIDLCNYAWTPIGNVKDYPTISFHGTFDGQNFAIKNLNASDTTPNYAAAGLFGSLCGTVQNLTLDGFTVKSTHYAGAICGFDDAETSATQILNCTVKNGSVTSTPELIDSEYDNGDKVGGIVGYIVSKDVVDGCTVENVTITAYRDLGGIAGYANSGSIITNNTVKNSTINCNCDPAVNYKGYTTNEKHDANEIIGEASATATVSGNTATNVTVNYVKPAVAVSTSEELAAAIASAADGDVINIEAAGTYTLPATLPNVTINGVSGAIVDATGAYGTSICSVPDGCTFNNVEFNCGTNDYHGFQHAGTINMNNCTLNGKLFSYGVMNFTDCTFVQTAQDYNMWCYGSDVTYTNCTFNGCGKFLNVYCESNTVAYNITLDGCTFNSSVAKKAAVNVKETCVNNGNMLNYNVVISNCKAVGSFPEAATYDATSTLYVIDPLVQVDDRNVSATESGIKVTLNGSVVYPK